MNAVPKPRINVAAGILEDDQGRVLLARRLEGGHLAGYWEFPGGKIDPAESRLEGLVRELAEELGIQVAAAEPLIEYQHDYPERLVSLYVWRVTEYRGEPSGREGQALRWVPVAQLPDFEGLLPADQPIVRLLTVNGAGAPN